MERNQKKKIFSGISGVVVAVSIAFGNSALPVGVMVQPQRAEAAGSFLYTSVDVMKWTKDRVTNQPSDEEIDAIVSTIAETIKPRYIAISIPLDATSDYPINHKPSPRSADEFTQVWSDAIHRYGLKVLWRGTWSGIEGIYNFPKRVGSNRFPAGTAESAIADGNRTWLGKTYQYIVEHRNFFADGDIWAPLPERTEEIFSDATSFIAADGAGLQANYARFFNDLKKISDQAFARINKRVSTGLTAQNYSEVASRWLPQSVLDTVGYTVIDHYGITHTPEEMEADLRKIYRERGKKIFLQEWGDYWHSDMPVDERKRYLQSMYAVWRNLVEEGILIGFNYWGAWGGTQEGILQQRSDGSFEVNERGRILALFFASVLPSSNPSQTAAVAGSVTASATIILPFNVRDGEAVKFSGSPTVYLVKPDGLYPFHTLDALQSYLQSTGWIVKDHLEPPQFFTVKNELATTVIARSQVSYPAGALVNDRGTIYLIRGGKKVGFSNLAAFQQLGYSLGNVISGDTSFYPTDSYQIDSASNGHPWGTWVLIDQTVYYVHPDGLIGVSDWRIFLDNGGQSSFIIKAHPLDLLKPALADVMSAADVRVYR